MRILKLNESNEENYLEIYKMQLNETKAKLVREKDFKHMHFLNLKFHEVKDELVFIKNINNFKKIYGLSESSFDSLTSQPNTKSSKKQKKEFKEKYIEEGIFDYDFQCLLLGADLKYYLFFNSFLKIAETHDWISENVLQLSPYACCMYFLEKDLLEQFEGFYFSVRVWQKVLMSYDKIEYTSLNKESFLSILDISPTIKEEMIRKIEFNKHISSYIK